MKKKGCKLFVRMFRKKFAIRKIIRRNKKIKVSLTLYEK